MKHKLTIKNRKGITLIEVMIAMIVFSFAIIIIFTLPRSIMNYAKAVDVKMDLYQLAVNEAEKIVASSAGSDKTVDVFINGATYTGKIEFISTSSIQWERVVKDSSGISNTDSNSIPVNYASVTFYDQKKDYSISFNIVPKP